MLRRVGRRSDAGRALGDALELARECGARLLEERALEELEVAGTRVQRAALRGADALSPSERRVVALAIEGLSNRQIAEALFVTRKAVEWHLGNAYRKLDVRSRRELPAALGEASQS
jgi:DNA-binding CsgD family transcriptional regulator